MANLTHETKFIALIEKRIAAYLKRNSKRVKLVAGATYADDLVNGQSTCIVCAIGAAGCAFMGRTKLFAEVDLPHYWARDAIIESVAKKTRFPVEFVKDIFLQMESGFEGHEDEGEPTAAYKLGRRLRARSMLASQFRVLRAKRRSKKYDIQLKGSLHYRRAGITKAEAARLKTQA